MIVQSIVNLTRINQKADPRKQVNEEASRQRLRVLVDGHHCSRCSNLTWEDCDTSSANAPVNGMHPTLSRSHILCKNAESQHSMFYRVMETDQVFTKLKAVTALATHSSRTLQKRFTKMMSLNSPNALKCTQSCVSAKASKLPRKVSFCRAWCVSRCCIKVKTKYL